MKQVKARKDAVAGRSSKGVEEWLRGTKNCTVIQGHARFQSPNTVAVNDEVLGADNIYINVGGRARILEMPGIHDVPFLTNSSINTEISNGETIFRTPAGGVDRISAGYERFCCSATCVHASTAKFIAFDDGDGFSGGGIPRRERRPRLSRPDNDCIETLHARDGNSRRRVHYFSNPIHLY
jgi:hypothetical protein